MSGIGIVASSRCITKLARGEKCEKVSWRRLLRAACFGVKSHREGAVLRARAIARTSADVEINNHVVLCLKS